MRFKLWFEQEEQNQLSVTNLERWVLSDDVEEIRKSVDKLNAIAQKLDMKPIVLTIKARRKPEIVDEKELGSHPDETPIKIPEEESRIWFKWTAKRVEEYIQAYGREPEEVLVNLTGEVPRVGHHEFVATIEPKADEDGKVINILRTAPGQQVPDKFKRDFQGHCDHCCTSRFRKQTYLLRDKRDGSYKVVGGNCLADFLRKDDLNSQIRWLKLLDDLDKKPSVPNIGVKRFDTFPTKEFIKAAMASINLFGFKKSTIEYQGNIMANEDATKEYVKYYFGIFNSYFKEIESKALRIKDEIKEEMKNIKDEDIENLLKWVKEEQAKEDSSAYIHNLYALSIQSHITERDAGMMASLPQAYIRAHKKSNEVKEEKYAIPDWKAGDTISFIGKVKSRGTYDSQYGTNYILTFHTEEGYYIKWFSSSFDAKKGDVIKVEKAKVKGIENDVYLQKMVTTIKGTSGTKAYNYDPSVHTKEYDDVQKELPKILKKDKDYQKNKAGLMVFSSGYSIISNENMKEIEEKINNFIKETEEKDKNETDSEKKKKHLIDLQKYDVYRSLVRGYERKVDKKIFNSIGELKYEFPKEILGIELNYIGEGLNDFIRIHYQDTNKLSYHDLNYFDNSKIEKYMNHLNSYLNIKFSNEKLKETIENASIDLDTLVKNKWQQIYDRLKKEVEYQESKPDSSPYEINIAKRNLEKSEEKYKEIKEKIEKEKSA